MLMYKSNPSTGEIYETKEVEDIPEVREDAIRRGWYETPRWQRNPRPTGLSQENIYERINQAYVPTEYPRTLHKAGFLTVSVESDHEKAAKVAAGWSLTPVPETLTKDGVLIDVYTADAKQTAVAGGWKPTKEKK